MSLSTFAFTRRARPIVELGIGDSRVGGPAAVWQVSKWNDAASVWAGVEPTWVDVSCDVQRVRFEYGRRATTDRFVPGVATVMLDNASGWADLLTPPSAAVLAVWPGRALRIGIVHATLGRRWLFRGFVDTSSPSYSPVEHDTVELSVIDALGEVNRAKLSPFAVAQDAGQTISARFAQTLDRAKWPTTKRDIQATADTLIADTQGGQVADLLGRMADSNGGVAFGDTEGNVCYRFRDWQTFMPGTPPDGTIGNVSASDVCPVEWERPYNRADISTRAIYGRDAATAVVVDDATAQVLYGIEPFERTDLLTQSDTLLSVLASRALRVRSSTTAPRVRTVRLDASTADSALDLMTTVDVYKPSRYRCRLRYPRGTVFDAEHFATSVAHEITQHRWSLDLGLDFAAPFAAAGGRWTQAGWDQALWATLALMLDELRDATTFYDDQLASLRALVEHLEGAAA